MMCLALKECKLRKESKVLILLAILLASAGSVVAQEDLNDEDLQTLLEDDKAPLQEVKEVSQAPAETPTAEAKPSEPVSSETVDLNALESSDPDMAADAPVEEMPSEETPDTSISETPPNDLESLPSDTSPETTVGPGDTMAKPDTFQADDLESIKKDIGEEGSPTEDPKKEESTPLPSTIAAPTKTEPSVFDVGREERELLTLAQNIQGLLLKLIPIPL